MYYVLYMYMSLYATQYLLFTVTTMTAISYITRYNESFVLHKGLLNDIHCFVV